MLERLAVASGRSSSGRAGTAREHPIADGHPYASARRARSASARGHADLCRRLLLTSRALRSSVCAPSEAAPGTGQRSGSTTVALRASPRVRRGRADARSRRLRSPPCARRQPRAHMARRAAHPVRSSRPSPERSWFLNSAGRWTSDDFGFGAVDACVPRWPRRGRTSRPESQFANARGS